MHSVFLGLSFQTLSAEISELEEADMSLDDLDDHNSPYLRLDDLKRRHLVVWKQLCRIRKTSSRAQGILLSRFRFEGETLAIISCL